MVMALSKALAGMNPSPSPVFDFHDRHHAVHFHSSGAARRSLARDDRLLRLIVANGTTGYASPANVNMNAPVHMNGFFILLSTFNHAEPMNP
jgi:hypothetical protein